MVFFRFKRGKYSINFVLNHFSKQGGKSVKNPT